MRRVTPKDFYISQSFFGCVEREMTREMCGNQNSGM